jgi:hypothetical protein
MNNEMNDQEFFDFVERRTFNKMFEGCLIDDDLDDEIDPAPWAVSLRAVDVFRLLDMAKTLQKVTK